MKNYQFISQGKDEEAQFEGIQHVLDLGLQWIQIRWKEASKEQVKQLAERVKLLCESYKARMIINDHLEIAHEVDADGLHLGLNDDKIALARQRLGPQKIIGGTANSLEDILQRTAEGVDYIGLGPYRFTSTKAQLSPVLGLEGYQQLLNSLAQLNIVPPPIYAIGGIQEADIPALLSIGIHGIAASGLFLEQFNPKIQAS